jgi:hypothetical protein
MHVHAVMPSTQSDDYQLIHITGKQWFGCTMLISLLGAITSHYLQSLWCCLDESMGI